MRVRRAWLGSACVAARRSAALLQSRRGSCHLGTRNSMHIGGSHAAIGSDACLAAGRQGAREPRARCPQVAQPQARVVVVCGAAAPAARCVMRHIPMRRACVHTRGSPERPPPKRNTESNRSAHAATYTVGERARA
eukprot:6825655-Prymnesium_polylepis.1